MNQPQAPAPATRSSGTVDAPDMFFVLRRYIWLILAGTLVGTLISSGLYYYLRSHEPKYTAKVTFQVLPPAATPGTSQGGSEVSYVSQEESAIFIRRQIYLIRSEPVVEQALRSDEFQHDYHDPASPRRSRWLTEHPVQSKRALLNDLDVIPIPTSNMFTINFTASDSVEAARLADAVARVYLDSLRTDNKINQAQHLAELNTVVQQQETEVARLERELEDFRNAHNVDAIAPRHELEIKTLESLNNKLLEAESNVTAMRSYFDGMKAQVENGTLTLSVVEESGVENDPQLRNLEQSKMSLDQDLGVVKSQTGTSNENVRALETRIAIVVKQMNDRRAELTATARIRMQDGAQQAYGAALATEQYFKETHRLKDLEVRDLDHWLVGAQQHTDRLKAQAAILTQLRSQYTLEQLKGSTDDSRIRRMGGNATPPDDISWPMWYRFIPVGLGLGLGLSYLMAYLFELTNTRIRTPNDITRTLQLPLLGFVPDQQDDSAVTGELSTTIRTSPNSMIAESFRQIRGRLIAQADGSPVKTLLVASISPGGGATTVASNIANGMALNEMRVLLVDCNFYRPGLPRSYKNLPAIGLAEVIAQPAQLDAAIVESQQMPNLHLMGTGNIGNGTAAEMLEGRSFREVLDKLKARYDIVIFDGAPLSLVSDSVALGGRVDGVVAVVRAGEVSRGTVARVREQLRHVRARLLGIVLNAAQTHGAGYFKENYRTFYEYAGRGARSTPASVN